MESKNNLPVVQRNSSWAMRLAMKEPTQTSKELEKKMSDIFGEQFSPCIKTFSSDYGFDSVTTGYDITTNDKDKLQEAYLIAYKSLEPYPKRELEKQLEILYSIQAKVGEGTAKSKAKLIALVMGDIPADLANFTIKYNAKYNKFWSTYEELYKPISSKLEAREKLIKTLESKLKTV